MKAYLTSRHSVVTVGNRLGIAMAGLVVGALAWSVEQPLAATIGTCQPTKVKFSAEPVVRDTTSGVFVNIPGTGISFTQGGASNSCVIVYFFAEVAAAESTILNIRATLDDVASAIPTDRQFFYSDLLWQTRGASFIFPSVAPGSHTIRIQYHSNPTGKKVWVKNSNTIIHFAPP